MSREIDPNAAIGEAISWKKHEISLRRDPQVSAEGRDLLSQITHPPFIGYAEYQVRPGKFGKVDVFHYLEACGLNYQECLVLSDLTEDQLETLVKKDLELKWEMIIPLGPKAGISSLRKSIACAIIEA